MTSLLATDIYKPDEWREFFLMVGGGAAALTGLVFVAMSLNLHVIAKDATHRYRAIGTLAGFTATFMICALAGEVVTIAGARPRPNGQSVAVAALHPAIVAPLSGVATRRLSLQPLGHDDLDELTAMFAHREVWEFEYGRGLTRSESEAFLDRQINLWTECGFGGCGVRESVQMDLIGVVGLGVPVASPELLPPVTIGWRFSPSSWGKGYATEAATALLDQAFRPVGLDRVGCVTNAENRRSVAVAERLGMTVITETMVPSDDGTRMVAALLFQVARNHWLAVRARRART